MNMQASRAQLGAKQWFPEESGGSWKGETPPGAARGDWSQGKAWCYLNLSIRVCVLGRAL